MPDATQRRQQIRHLGGDTDRGWRCCCPNTQIWPGKRFTTSFEFRRTRSIRKLASTMRTGTVAYMALAGSVCGAPRRKRRVA